MIDIHSATWQAVRDWAEKQINEAQLGLEHSADQVAIMRHQGRMSAYRELLGLAEAPEQAERDVEYIV